MKAMLVLAPIVPLLFGGVLTLWHWARPAKVALTLLSALVSLGASALLYAEAARGTILTHAVGGWPAPFGIVLVADHMSATFSLLSGISGFLMLWLQAQTTDSARERHHLFSLCLFLLAGVQMSFLTGDLFNLFVAFEVMLVASYALTVLGSGREQLREGFRYIVMNLVASALLVTACGLTYGVLGTLNFAHLAQRMQELPPHGIISAVTVMLFLVFAAKASLFPLGFWLPGTYPAVSAPLGGYFAAMLTKVGVYAMLRVFVTVFPQNAVGDLLLLLGGVTMLYGALGAISQHEWRRILSFTVMASVGYLMFGLGIGTPEALSATLFYLLVSVLVTLAFFFVAHLAELYTGSRRVLAARGVLERWPLLAALFLLCALTLAGLPPTAGFIAKFALIRAGLTPMTPLAVTGVVAALLASLLLLYAMINIWRHFFWGEDGGESDVRPVPANVKGPVYTSGALLLGLLLGAGPLAHDMTSGAAQLLDPGQYIRAVLGEQPVKIPPVPTKVRGGHH